MTCQCARGVAYSRPRPRSAAAVCCLYRGSGSQRNCRHTLPSRRSRLQLVESKAVGRLITRGRCTPEPGSSHTTARTHRSRDWAYGTASRISNALSSRTATYWANLAPLRLCWWSPTSSTSTGDNGGCRPCNGSIGCGVCFTFRARVTCTGRWIPTTAAPNARSRPPRETLLRRWPSAHQRLRNW